jgi:16S rRNA (adenine1518-N6/adenine1519-N6)-dimethyltransferase
VQKEVAERITRDPKSSLLALSVAAFGTPSYICTVKRGHFTPSPKVDSAIIAVYDINRAYFTGFTPTHFFTLLHLGFGQKRKQLLGNLAAHFERSDLETIFTTLDIPLKTRAEDLNLQNWLRLVAALPPVTT